MPIDARYGFPERWILKFLKKNKNNAYSFKEIFDAVKFKKSYYKLKGYTISDHRAYVVEDLKNQIKEGVVMMGVNWPDEKDFLLYFRYNQDYEKTEDQEKEEVST